MNILYIFVVLLCSCLPWAVKGECSFMHKTDYRTDGPEQKCGAKVEVTLIQGGR